MILNIQLKLTIKFPFNKPSKYPEKTQSESEIWTLSVKTTISTPAINVTIYEYIYIYVTQTCIF